LRSHALSPAKIAGKQALAKGIGGSSTGLPVFVFRDLDLWAHTQGVTLDSRPGKPTDDVHI